MEVLSDFVPSFISSILFSAPFLLIFISLVFCGKNEQKIEPVAKPGPKKKFRGDGYRVRMALGLDEPIMYKETWLEIDKMIKELLENALVNPELVDLFIVKILPVPGEKPETLPFEFDLIENPVLFFKKNELISKLQSKIFLSGLNWKSPRLLLPIDVHLFEKGKAADAIKNIAICWEMIKERLVRECKKHDYDFYNILSHLSYKFPCSVIYRLVAEELENQNAFKFMTDPKKYPPEKYSAPLLLLIAMRKTLDSMPKERQEFVDAAREKAMTIINVSKPNDLLSYGYFFLIIHRINSMETTLRTEATKSLMISEQKPVENEKVVDQPKIPEEKPKQNPNENKTTENLQASGARTENRTDLTSDVKKDAISNQKDVEKKETKVEVTAEAKPKVKIATEATPTTNETKNTATTQNTAA
uniref:Uncharacterized protein n=1 Tax=Panagrolaimus sp. JU765 TaxID=591449 RepID=A0AC34PZ53_9BILA